MDSILAGINLEKFNCEHVDVRIEQTQKTVLTSKNGELEQGITIPESGALIRVFNSGQWYYASTTDLLAESIVDSINKLIISSGGEASKPEDILSGGGLECEKICNLEDDFAVFASIREKQKLFPDMEKILDSEILVVDSTIAYIDTLLRKWYRNSKGQYRYYDTEQSGLKAYYVLKEDDSVYEAGYLKYGHRISDFAERAAELAADLEEAKKFLHAPTIKPGKYPVVLSERVTGVFAHESFGHKSEADFMLSDENMKLEWEIGKQVGSEILSIVDEGLIPGTSGYMPFDDEGVNKEKTYLIDKGILRGRLHSQHTATVLEEKPTGNARAINFHFEPIVRMTNTYVEAGDLSFEELLAPIKEGFYIDDFNHGSGMSTFTIAPSRAYKIENGKITDPVKVNVISGTIFETLYNIDALSDEVKIFSFVGGGCGKMEQMPLSVGFGGPKVRVKEMNVS
jgi:TldD protein